MAIFFIENTATFKLRFISLDVRTGVCHAPPALPGGRYHPTNSGTPRANLRGSVQPSTRGQPCHLRRIEPLLNCAPRLRARAGLPKTSDTTSWRPDFGQLRTNGRLKPPNSKRRSRADGRLCRGISRTLAGPGVDPIENGAPRQKEVAHPKQGVVVDTTGVQVLRDHKARLFFGLIARRALESIRHLRVTVPSRLARGC